MRLGSSGMGGGGYWEEGVVGRGCSARRVLWDEVVLGGRCWGMRV
jgi:hypothetical protein